MPWDTTLSSRGGIAVTGSSIVWTRGENRRRDREHWSMVPLVVVGVLWSLVMSHPIDHERVDSFDRSVLSLDWADVALRARAAQSPTISSSPAK